MDKFFNLKDFDVEPKHPSRESLRRWRSACTIVKNRKRRFRVVADLDRRSEAEKKKRQMQEQVRVALCIRDTLQLIESHEDVPIGDTVAGRFQEFVDDIISTVKCGDVKEKIRLALCIQETALQLIEVRSLLSLEDVSSSEYTMTEAAEAGRFQDFFAGVRSISDDDAAISLIMQSVHSFSLKGKYRRRIISWQKGAPLGSGSFGSVYEGFTDDGFFFAVKEVSLQDQGTQGEQSVLQLEQEISLLGQFEHDNIVQYFGTEKARCIDWFVLGRKKSCPECNKIMPWFHLRCICCMNPSTIILCNDCNYHCGRDIKCANILVNANGSVKLADFGLAKAITMNDVKSCKGSPFWMAPEVVNSKNGGYGLPADIWSVGCTVLEMLTRCRPYFGVEWVQALFKIARGELPPIPDSVSRDARDFILKCLQVNPNDRPTAAQLMEHPFVKRPLPTSWGLPTPHHFIMQS
ncbi:mitogen-activated protein kinase kinase kinase 1-like isoform X3 [Citrus sinensis]|uniref:mitogen-activated protein kinase kinase kinase 1-like isoform X3 n=1 Tax=Citrus sinensis TaxID=2711 RepID=UPI000CED54ED|nr:mitogen-activated protein kinase kinase kinase 1-like isoform X3 [Citrus sinensis]XP_024039887.1 mitogen-activated protein kinase kinase kinase 1 isoform X3 [Citrus x clementina]